MSYLVMDCTIKMMIERQSWKKLKGGEHGLCTNIAVLSVLRTVKRQVQLLALWLFTIV